MFRYLVVGLVSICIAGCGNGRAYQVLQSDIVTAEAKLQKLGTHLDSDRMSNDIRLAHYSRRIIEVDPELEDLANTLALEGTTRGRLYESLVQRLNDFKQTIPPENADREASAQASLALQSIWQASQEDEFNRALADPVNVLADLSKGELPRVDAIAAEQEVGEGLEPATQLVGNPQYGEWQSHSSGGSFWVWYGQYALLRSVLGGRNYFYSDWAGNRRYSYYHDYGRGNYTSPSQRQRQQTTQTRAQQKFSREGKSFASPYARKRPGASTQVARAKARPVAARASSRSYNSTRARSPSRGK